MEFRAPTVAMQQNARKIEYLTKNLADPEAGRRRFDVLINELGNAVDCYPDWHPIITAPQQVTEVQLSSPSISELSVYAGADHTVEFVRGFVTCPYSELKADKLVSNVNQVPGLCAYRLHKPLYSDNAYPVVVVANAVELEADGTIRSRDTLVWFAQLSAKEAQSSQVAETWWNTRSNILGCPHGSRSSLFVNQYTGVHMRKILEVMNNSGMFGPIKESSLDMLSKKKRDAISENLLRTAVNNWDKIKNDFDFELRGEICNVKIRDTWDDGLELSIRVMIGKFDLSVLGFYYAENDRITHTEPHGKRVLAEKFL
jgi:hypothetical protein